MTTTDSHKEKPMIRTEIATITPELAKQLLGGNTKNRRIKQGTVDSYARDMKAGNWRVMGERPKMLKWSAATERFPVMVNEDGETVSEFGYLAPGKARGERVAGSKLTERDVQEIRDLYSEGRWTQEKLAAEYGVSRSAITLITSGKNWKHVA